MLAGLIPTRQVFLATENMPPILKQPVLDAQWVVQLRSGEVVIAIPSEETESETTEQAIERTRELIPSELRDVPFSRTWSGVGRRLAQSIPIIDHLLDCKTSGRAEVWISHT